MKLIDKDALVAEIKRRLNHQVYLSVEREIREQLLNGLLLFINTLEVKEADLTPTVYVVTRCEEHSDYVEQVFLDENKAIEYCKQFEGENEYGRDITKIEVML